MPCQMESPTNYELKVVEAAKLLVYVYTQLFSMKENGGFNGLPPTDHMKRLSHFARGEGRIGIDKTTGDKLTAELCGLLGRLDEETTNKIVYDARSRDSRRLADWWEAHQIADQKRELAEREDKLLSGQLFGNSDLPKDKKQAILKWYKSLTGTGQSYVNLLQLIRTKQ